MTALVRFQHSLIGEKLVGWQAEQLVFACHGLPTNDASSGPSLLEFLLELLLKSRSINQGLRSAVESTQVPVSFTALHANS